MKVNHSIILYVLLLYITYQHVKNELKAIEEIIYYKKGGKAMILVWALEQPSDSRRKFKEQDNMVSWKDKKGNLLGERYYYVFKKDELESLINSEIKIIKSFYELGNWGVILEKLV